MKASPNADKMGILASPNADKMGILAMLSIDFSMFKWI